MLKTVVQSCEKTYNKIKDKAISYMVSAGLGGCMSKKENGIFRNPDSYRSLHQHPKYDILKRR